jgi:hypothetical protein
VSGQGNEEEATMNCSNEMLIALPTAITHLPSDPVSVNRMFNRKVPELHFQKGGG